MIGLEKSEIQVIMQEMVPGFYLSKSLDCMTNTTLGCITDDSPRMREPLDFMTNALGCMTKTLGCMTKPLMACYHPVPNDSACEPYPQ